ncbi:MAG: GTP cyclohydrolase II [Spirochaetota bacterium]
MKGISMANSSADTTTREAGEPTDERGRLEEKLTGKPDFLHEDFSRNGRNGKHGPVHVHLVASASLPTRYGDFRIFGFYDERDEKEHTALVRGDVAGKSDVPVRVHSQCHTGDVWGSLRCDCRDQLEAAMAYIADAECGAVVYMKQEGRGIGLLNKLKAYKLQDLGLNTIEANHYLGYPAEARDYAIAARILDELSIQSVALLSNNPDKIEKLEAEGVTITRRIPIVIASNEHNHDYLATKRSEMGHLI